MTTRVPSSQAEISNSSMSRRAPPKPRPSPPLLEKPSVRACGTSPIPGPTSSKKIRNPTLESLSTSSIQTSPDPAYCKRFRASSLAAVTRRVCDSSLNPRSWARRRKDPRTRETSSLCRTSIRKRSDVSALTFAPSGTQPGNAAVDVDRGVDRVEGHAQFHQGQCHGGTHADDHRLGAEQP